MFSIYLSTKFEFLHCKFSIDAHGLLLKDLHFIWFLPYFVFSFPKFCFISLVPKKKKLCFIGYHETNKHVSWNFNVHFQNQYHYCNVLLKIILKIISKIKFKKKNQNLLWLHFNSITLWVVLCIWKLKPMLRGSSLFKEPLTLVLTLVYLGVGPNFSNFENILAFSSNSRTGFNFTYTIQTF
jgi:hypothetical protein